MANPNARCSPQLVGNRGVAGLKLAIAEPTRYAIEPKLDRVRALVAFLPDRRIGEAVPARSTVGGPRRDPGLLRSGGQLGGWSEARTRTSRPT
jgi:hypothetical protein